MQNNQPYLSLRDVMICVRHGLEAFPPVPEEPLRASRVWLLVPSGGLTDVGVLVGAVAEDEGAGAAGHESALVPTAWEATGEQGGEQLVAGVNRDPGAEWV